MADLFEAINRAPQPGQDYLKQLFKSMPASVRSCHVVKMKAYTKFISANDSCNEVWILIEGHVRAIEEQISGDIYVFSEFEAPEIFGEMEGIAGNSSYKATLVTSTDCQFIVLPMENYLNWIRNDSEALFSRAQIIMGGILDQAKKERVYLLLDGTDRLILYLTKYYQEHAKDQICSIRVSRQQIAEQTGFSIKTVNRSIKKLSDSHLITKKGGKMVISEIQYEQLLELADKKLSK